MDRRKAYRAILVFSAMACCMLVACDDNGSGSAILGNRENAGIVGTWKGTTADSQAMQWTFVFTADSVIGSVASQIYYKGSYSVDNSRNPRWLDIHITQSPDQQYVGETTLGIYRIEGDTLTFAANEPGVAERPSSFEMTGETVVLILVRQ